MGVGVKLKKIDIYSDTSAYVIGVLSVLAFFTWQYPSLPLGWRFLGVLLISVATGIGFQVLIFMFNEWRSKRIEKNITLSMCRATGVDEDSTEIDDKAKSWRYMISRYSNELLVNRLSDLFGVFTIFFSTLINSGITVWYLGIIAYSVWTWDFSEPFLLFLPLLFRLIFIIFELFIGFICKVLFNRYPGEARKFNKNYDKIRKEDPLLSSKEFRDSIHS